MSGPLQDVRVLEHGTYITGPAAGMLLGDLGADVVKIELPQTGDPMRAFQGGLYSPNFQSCNRNKRSVALDTTKPDQLETFDALVREADVYIQNFRPGVAERIGVGEKRLRALNPKLIYCAISGFGPDGPYADRPSYDTVAQASSGFLGLLVNPANPRVVGPAIADSMTGFYAAYGVLGALHRRGVDGTGSKVDVSMFEAMMHFNLDAFTHLFSENMVVGPFDRARISQSYVLECADGKWIALHMSSPEKFWQGLANAMERPEILLDQRFSNRLARVENQDALIQVLQQVFRDRSRESWCQRLLANDVPHAPMYNTAEVADDPQAQHLQVFVESTHPVLGKWKTVRSPVTFNSERTLTVVPPPLIGEHTKLFNNGWSPRLPTPSET